MILIHTISLLYMTCRQLDSEEAEENSSNNMPNPILWEDIHVFRGKPRRNKNRPQVKRYSNNTGNWSLILAWKKEAIKQTKCFKH